MLRWQGTQRAVAILVSFTELPSILELSRFGDDDRRVSLAAVPFAHRWLAEILPGTGILETRAIHAGGGGGRPGAELGTRPQVVGSLLRPESLTGALVF